MRRPLVHPENGIFPLKSWAPTRIGGLLVFDTPPPPHTHTPRITLRKVRNILQCHEILKLTWGELESFQKTTITPPTARALKLFFF